MRQSTTLLKLQTCLFLSVQQDDYSVTTPMGGHKTMACLSGKGHGKKCLESIQKVPRKLPESYQKVTRNLPESCQKVARKLPESCQKVAKSCQKVARKLPGSCQKVARKS